MKIAAKIGLTIYCLSAIAFAIELFGEITGIWLFGFDWLIHELTAMATLLGFMIGGAFIWANQKSMQRDNRKMARSLDDLRSEFSVMLSAQFETWGLTDAERDIALLTIKGLSVNEIAVLRETREGTIKSQNHKIYRKANVKNRTQLVSSVIEELLAD